MSMARFIVGDTREQLAALPDCSVDLVLSSPPFLALRSYLPVDHPDKGDEIGSEATPGEFLDVILDVVELCAQKLAPHGSLVFEFGDTYSGSGGGGGDYNADGLRSGQPKFDGSGKRIRETRRESYITGGVEPPQRRDTSSGWPLDKSLTMIPSSFAWALAYGRNPWTGRTTDPWRIRNFCPWVRPNPPVGALGDKFRPGTSYLTVACKARDRWFDLDAVRTAYSEKTNARVAKGVDQLDRKGKSADRDGNWSSLPERDNHGAGAPPLDWFNIPTQPYAGSHYATWPQKLALPFIESMCGQPRRRLTSNVLDTEGDADYLAARAAARNGERLGMGSTGRQHIEPRRVLPTGDWSDCGHGDDWRNGLVLDPFAGSGTTLQVATGCGRDAIGIDLDARNLELARQRIGMFLTEEPAA